MKKTLLLCLFIASSTFAVEPTSFLLGRELLSEKSAELAAIEFRRYALESETPEAQSQTYLHAAHAYLQAGSFDVSRNMLQQAERLDSDHPALPLLYSELAAQEGDIPTALYFLDLHTTPEETNNPLDVFAARRGAEMLLRAGKPEEARKRLLLSPLSETNALSSLDIYGEAPRKSPAVGGLLGLIPGAGYWYSGEIANGFRSLILNSVFLFGMIHTAQEEQWGAFAAISFFEITWYSGSIYGGIDAAHRYNRNQLDQCINRLDVPTLEPDPNSTIPVFQLKVLF